MRRRWLLYTDSNGRRRCRVFRKDNELLTIRRLTIGRLRWRNKLATGITIRNDLLSCKNGRVAVDLCKSGLGVISWELSYSSAEGCTDGMRFVEEVIGIVESGEVR